MRQALRGIAETDYWVYGLTEADFEYTVSLGHTIVDSMRSKVAHDLTGLEAQPPDPELLDDAIYYNWVESQYVWHFCLWRLQAILEGLLVHTFIPKDEREGLTGLRFKLDAMLRAGYIISDDDYADLMAWGKLRNALSHAPPEQFRPGPLEESDIVEYQALVTGLCKEWRQAKVGSN